MIKVLGFLTTVACIMVGALAVVGFTAIIADMIAKSLGLR